MQGETLIASEIEIRGARGSLSPAPVPAPIGDAAPAAVDSDAGPGPWQGALQHRPGGSLLGVLGMSR